VFLTLVYDLRSSASGAPHDELYAAALDQCAWAEGLHGISHLTVVLSEHHGSVDGYLPSPMVLGAAIAGRTQRATIMIAAVIAPLHNPLHLAEDLAVLDLVSDGRAVAVLAAGYRHEEFEMFGADLATRGAAMDETIEVLKQAWTGEPFQFRGTTVRVSPRPKQRPHPPIILGGSSPAAARRAARRADGFLPSSPALMTVYREELVRLGRDPGPAPPEDSRAEEFVVHITKDPDRAWEQISEFCLHDTNTYAEWMRDGSGGSGPFVAATDVDALRATGSYLVLTPEECVERARAQGHLMVKPLIGGMPPALAWESLRLIESDVLPALS
jgi:alkanesulfonate monooxygenase SsuD/methylene tetrahydromethanopterin reductase-like flavin-dependent oxidoreductase (luciferase family)